ncbi:MAG: glycosyltransferase [Chlamydiia bacterium]|nr:glycosyltransferase [Chlamydiia bacterium]
MIVKNETDVICRCLESVLPIIDTWVIVDTGSTDGTQEMIKKFMKEKGKPGELHERPWKNFGHNRNEALDLARDKADYIFFIDADEYLKYEPGFRLPYLHKDFYYVNICHSNSRYCRNLLVKADLDWKWVGVLHEVVCSEKAKTYDTLQKVNNIYTTEGARSKDPQKFLKDAAILEEGLKEEPDNSRYVFYLAQSYRDAGVHDKALENYERRIKMGGWDQELYWSHLRVAELKEALKYPKEEVVKAYKAAFDFRRSRVEPLYQLAHMYREEGDFESCYEVASIAASIPETDDILFVQQWMIDYGIDLERSIAAYYLEDFKECQKISVDLLKKKSLPDHVKQCVKNNLGFANSKLLEKFCHKKGAVLNVQ